eukprot:COSAG01_NODE_294_length_19294_cov_35.559312_9_plen_43_part_00
MILFPFISSTRKPYGGFFLPFSIKLLVAELATSDTGHKAHRS